MATLKISDLSVGDWVQDMGGNYTKVVGIWQGSNFSYQVDCLRDDKADTITPCNLHPIPITAEILEKNGFKKVEPQWYMCEINGIHISIIVWENQRGRIEISYKSPFDDDNPLYIADFTANIPHIAVHHLQRVLRLAGVEKEIVL